jgi:hypothetical protein
MPEVIEQATTRTETITEVSSPAKPELGQASRLFLPIIDNGGGAIRSNFLLSVLNAFRGRDLHIERFSDSLVTRARNRAASYFLRQTDRDYIMFIDTDIIFTKDHIDMLMESDAPLLAGIYCIKQKGIAPCLNTLPGHVDTPSGGYVEIARAGTGFMRVHRSVLEKMKEQGDIFYINHGQDEWDFFRVGVVNKEYLSEDWWFCDRARELGFKVILDSRIQLRHEGVAIYPLEETIQKHVEENGGKTAVDQAA